MVKTRAGDVIGKGVTILRRPEVERRTGLSRSAIYELIAKGMFPRPIPLTPGAHGPVGWTEPEIEEYVADRLAARDRGEGRRRPQKPELTTEAR